MWISKKLREKSDYKGITYGKVLSKGEGIAVVGENSLGSPTKIMPYGLCSSVPDGKSVAVYQGAVLGVVGDSPVEVEKGEVCLYSKGGYILIKNNGEVVINGKTLEV